MIGFIIAILGFLIDHAPTVSVLSLAAIVCLVGLRFVGWHVSMWWLAVPCSALLLCAVAFFMLILSLRNMH